MLTVKKSKATSHINGVYLRQDWGEDGTVRVSGHKVSSLEFTDGTLTIDSDKGEITHTDGSFLLGRLPIKLTAEEGLLIHTRLPPLLWIK